MTVVQKEIFTGLYDYLVSDSEINASVGGTASGVGRIYFGLVPSTDALPFILVSIIDTAAFDTFDCNGYIARVQVTVFTKEEDGPASCMDLLDQLIRRLHRSQEIELDEHAQMRVEWDISRGPFKEEQAWRADADFTLMGFSTNAVTVEPLGY